MAKTKVITFMCESTQNFSTHGSKIKVVAELTDADLGELVNSMPAQELFIYLPDSALEAWAKENGFVKA